MANPLAVDLDAILAGTGSLWDQLRDAQLFVAGGTGFFGCWLLESLCWAHDQLGLGCSATVLTRNPAAFARKAPHLASHPAITVLRGDVETFEFPPGQFPFVIHAATEASAALNVNHPTRMLDVIIGGTRRMLEFARQAGTRRFLFVSAGAVYGSQPPSLTHVPESYGGAPDPLDLTSAYAEGKRVAEFLCATCHARHGLEVTIARCFAFVGPYLPLDVHFAIGNFIRDALAGGPIIVGGDGTPHRSYMYASDLAAWLWTILLRGQPCRPYNVGSETAVTIGELAQVVAEVFEARAGRRPIVKILGSSAGRSWSYYVPSTQRAREELGLQESTELRAAIWKTAEWHWLGHCLPASAEQGR